MLSSELFTKLINPIGLFTFPEVNYSLDKVEITINRKSIAEGVYNYDHHKDMGLVELTTEDAIISSMLKFGFKLKDHKTILASNNEDFIFYKKIPKKLLAEYNKFVESCHDAQGLMENGHGVKKFDPNVMLPFFIGLFLLGQRPPENGYPKISFYNSIFEYHFPTVERCESAFLVMNVKRWFFTENIAKFDFSKCGVVEKEFIELYTQIIQKNLQKMAGVNLKSLKERFKTPPNALDN